MFLSAGDVLLLPIMEFAGKDISSWFDPKTEDVSADQTYPLSTFSLLVWMLLGPLVSC